MDVENATALVCLVQEFNESAAKEPGAQYPTADEPDTVRDFVEAETKT